MSVESAIDPRLSSAGSGWVDQVFGWVPKRLRNLGVIAALVFIAWVLFAANGRWTLVGQQVVAGLNTGSIAALAGLGLVVAYRATGVFNFAFAGIATISAFVMYELTFYHSVPRVIAMAIVVLGVGPLMGALMDLVVFRSLERRSAGTAEKLVANLGVLILLLGIGAVVYGEQSYQPNPIFSQSQAFQIGSGNGAVPVSWAVVGDVLVIVAAASILIAVFRYTPLGRQVRAVVDRRGLAELCVVNANRISMLSWAIGASFAALAGTLDAPQLGLQNGLFAIQILQTISVAVIARLRNIGAAIAAGLGLGVVQSLTSILHSPHYPSWLTWLPHVRDDIQVQIPILALLAFLLIYRTLDEAGTAGTGGLVTAAFGRNTRRSPAASFWGGLVILVGLVVIPLVLHGSNLQTAGEVVAFAVTFLSIVAVTGYSGHISLATSAFAGLGGYVTERLIQGRLPIPVGTAVGHVPVIVAMLIGGLLMVPVGIVIGYSALRRKGLILGLVTLAFAVIVNAFVFQSQSWFKNNNTSGVARPHFFGLSLQSDRRFLYFELVILALVLLLVRNLRSGVLGRILGAMRDSEKGAVSVGISLRRYKLLIFGASSFIAAIGGSLIAQQQGTLNLQPSGPLSPLAGLYWFGAVVVFGLSYRTSAIAAATLFVAFDVLVGKDQASLIIIGIIALFIGYLPGGLIGSLLRWFRGDSTDEASPMQRSLVAYALVQQRVESAPPVGDGLEPSAFAERLLTGSRR
ncbi:MAG: ABC transporter permease [Frankiaceae bacterium]|nr:ABC transporter permease [Frankiaceae bacterium]MBV9870000.1 ABC transporter permease [Frankiaceae bacterium]